MAHMLVSLLVGILLATANAGASPMPDEAFLARRITMEARGCSQNALLAVAYISGRNNRWAPVPAWIKATAQALDVAHNWQNYADPAPGATYLFSTHDMQLRSVQNLTSRSRYVASFPCANGLQLHAYAR